MAAPLNRIPPGLLEYFGIKTGEWGPRELAQQLVPVLDLARWYMDASAMQLQCLITGSPWGADTNASAVNVTSTGPENLVVGGQLRVPPGETWLILAAGIAWLQTAIDNDAQFWWQSGDTSSGYQIWPQRNVGYGQAPAPASAGQRQSGIVLTDPFWIPPGHQIAVGLGQVSIGVGGTVSILSAWLRLQRFKI